MLRRQVCSRVQVVPFQRPAILEAVGRVEENRLCLMGLLERPVQMKSHLARSALLVPTMDVQQNSLPSSSLSSMPSSTPCSLVFLDFFGSTSGMALAHFAPGQHIFVRGCLLPASLPNFFRVQVDSAGFVQDAPSPASVAEANGTHVIDPSTLLALVASTQSRWRAYFHCPSEWYPLSSSKNLSFAHKYTGVRLWTADFTTPPWVKKLLNCSECPHGPA